MALAASSVRLTALRRRNVGLRRAGANRKADLDDRQRRLAGGNDVPRRDHLRQRWLHNRHVEGVALHDLCLGANSPSLKVAFTLWPVLRSKSGIICSMARGMPPGAIRVTSAAPAPPAMQTGCGRPPPRRLPPQSKLFSWRFSRSGRRACLERPVHARNPETVASICGAAAKDGPRPRRRR